MVWPEMETLPCLIEAELVRAASSFGSNTATPDGWHPKAFQHITPRALKALTQLFQIFEVIAVGQKDLLTLLRLIPKPGLDQGVRPIALLQAMIRLYAKARAPRVKAWLTEHPPHKSAQVMAPTRNTTDSVWRAQMWALAKGEEGFRTAEINWDLSKAYDHIPFAALQDAAFKLRFPMQVLKVMLQVYAAPRHLVLMHGVISRPMFATRGILPGATTASYELCLLLHQVLAQMFALVSSPAVALSSVNISIISTIINTRNTNICTIISTSSSVSP